MKVLVAQARASARGGAEAYAQALCEVLRRDGHAVGHIDIDGHTRPDGRHTALTAPVRHGKLLMWAQVCRALPSALLDYDRVILAYGEGPDLAIPTLTIRHAPQLFGLSADALGHLGAQTTVVRTTYVRLCRTIAGPPRNGMTLANSIWTGAEAARLDNCRIDGVLYPPVTRPVPHAEPRDPFNIVALGRIVPNKRLDDAVAATAALRGSGCPVTLTILGRADGNWAKDKVKTWSRLGFVRVIPDATEEQKQQALARATFGFHGFRGEHFGIGVAEMILHGVLPLVHRSGGVRELVPDPSLQFDSWSAATGIFRRLLQNPAAIGPALSQLGTGPALLAATTFANHARRHLAPFLEPETGVSDAA